MNERDEFDFRFLTSPQHTDVTGINPLLQWLGYMKRLKQEQRAGSAARMHGKKAQPVQEQFHFVIYWL